LNCRICEFVSSAENNAGNYLAFSLVFCGEILDASNFVCFTDIPSEYDAMWSMNQLYYLCIFQWSSGHATLMRVFVGVNSYEFVDFDAVALLYSTL